MTYNNFSISKKEGKFYLKAKQPTEGYTEVTYGEGKKTYHKYFDTLHGVITNVETKEVQHEGRTLSFLQVSLVDGDVTNNISTNLKNKGGYTDEVKALISSLNGYKVGEPVTMNPYVSKTYSEKTKKEYENLNIYINYDNIKNEDGKNASTGYISYHDIPAPTKEDDGMGGIEWNWKPQTVFYFKKLEEIMSRINGAETSQETPITTMETKFEPVTEESDDYQELPF